MLKTHLIYILLFFTLFSCKEEHNSELKNSPSLYLQMHASDPVDWHIYSEKIFEKAKKTNKLILISIGYSACHWCHVMQNESFKDEAIAQIMNTKFYSVKIDREQLPDIDAYYAEQQEKLIGWAGWPMHIILDSKKNIIWTGIYLKPEKWKKLLIKVSEEYKKDNNFRLIEKVELEEKSTSKTIDFKEIISQLIAKCDTINGGLIPTHYNRKYPNVPLLKYLLKVSENKKDSKFTDFLKLTATKMALGGFNDQIDGGFFRFSMDKYWHIPHFEKMLYTNAQLIDFYANMYLEFGDDLYKKTSIETADFIIENLSSKKALFYGSLNADQNHEEGTYYVYTLEELKSALGIDFQITERYFNIHKSWLWQWKYYHLNTSYTDSAFAEINKLDFGFWLEKKTEIKRKLQNLRKNREKPQKDPKLISSWNAILMTSFLKLYQITNDTLYLQKAENIATFFRKEFKKEKVIKHYYLAENKTNANSYAEDYLYLAKAFIDFYKYNLDKENLILSKEIFEFYLSEKEGFTMFPKDDRVMPSAISVENYISKYLNNYFHTEKYKILDYNFSKIQENPQNYGSQLLQLYD